MVVMVRDKKLMISKPMSLSDIENIYKNMVLKQEFYNVDYAEEWLKTTEPYAAISRYIKDVIAPRTVLDIGCGIGQLISKLRELQVDAYGLEYSKDFISISPVKDYIYNGNIENLELFTDGSFDLIVCMEVLEHIPPTYLNKVISELKRISRYRLLITIPSYGPNEFGYAGLPLYEETWLRDALKNVPFKNLVVDESNVPDCGHISLASFRWWIEKFLYNGLIREPGLENLGYVRYGLLKYRWNIYLLNKIAQNHTDMAKNNYFMSNLYQPEQWDGYGIIRWSEKDFAIFLDNKEQSECVLLTFYSGIKELVYERKIEIKVFELKEDDDLRLYFKKKSSHIQMIRPDKWYTISVEGDYDPGIYKISIELDNAFIPDHLLRNNDRRPLGIALKEIGFR